MGGGGGGVQQKCFLIGLDLDTVLSAHSGPPQHPEVKTKTGGCLESSSAAQA